MTIRPKSIIWALIRVCFVCLFWQNLGELALSFVRRYFVYVCANVRMWAVGTGTLTQLRDYAITLLRGYVRIWACTCIHTICHPPISMAQSRWGTMPRGSLSWHANTMTRWHDSTSTRWHANTMTHQRDGRPAHSQVCRARMTNLGKPYELVFVSLPPTNINNMS